MIKNHFDASKSQKQSNNDSIVVDAIRIESADFGFSPVQKKQQFVNIMNMFALDPQSYTSRSILLKLDHESVQ